MPRLYLSAFFILMFSNLFSQTEIGKYIKFADEQVVKGDYYYALQYYEKALDIDSNSVDLLWKYAEALKAYKDYRKAEFYYAKVFEREEAGIYPESILNLALMQKFNGKYSEAIQSFKTGTKKYARDRKGYLYQKCRREIESCLWAISEKNNEADVQFERLPETVNTPNSEFGHTIKNGQFIFSSLRSDSIVQTEEVYSEEYTTQLYVSKYASKSFGKSEKIVELNEKGMNTGNGVFSLDGKRFYFSQCSSIGSNYHCKIMVAQYTDGHFSNIDSLGSIINAPGSNTTMPCIAELDGEEVLIFSSDRQDSEGGLDLWYSLVKNGNQYSKVKPIKNANSPDNELSPWWDKDSSRLYFSSSWHDGFGGYDVFYMDYSGDFKEPVNVGMPINSSANDLYFFKQADTAFVTSNRVGVIYTKNPTCCSDIFMSSPKVDEFYLPDSLIIVNTFPNQKESLEELNRRLPVTLYFHNDIPDPRSWDTITKVNYIASYAEYRNMLEKYQKEYSSGLTGEKAEDAREDIAHFFMEYVDQGVLDLNHFRDLLFEELNKGSRIRVTVKGFASPLAKSDYNVNLTKRRISSLINYLAAYEDGIFLPYLNGTSENGGKLLFNEIPFGEFTSNKLTSDNLQDQKNSVYSRSAMLERKIEIQSISFIEDRTIDFTLNTPSQIHHAGRVKQGSNIVKEFIITNISNEKIEFEETRIPCDCTGTEIEKMSLEPGESTKVKMKINTTGYEGPFVKSIYLKAKNVIGEYRLIVSAEIIP